MTTWMLTAVEACSALNRKRREGTPVHVLAEGFRRLGEAEAAWVEIQSHADVCRRARRLFEAHPLRAADALHLAAALLACEEQPSDSAFVTLDATLADAARREGFRVIGA